jgi:flagellar motor switch protein FliM
MSDEAPKTAVDEPPEDDWGAALAEAGGNAPGDAAGNAPGDDWGAALAEAAEDDLAAHAAAERILALPEPVAAPVEPTRVLNQAEIDSLLGFGDGQGGDDGAGSGMERVIARGLVSYERLPMLEIVFDRLVRILSTTLRNFTSDTVEVSIDEIQSLRFGDYLNSIPLPAMLSVFKAEEWDNYGLVVVDSALIYSVVDVLLGGRRGTSAMRIEGRPYTTIERTLVERLVNVVMNDLSEAFAPLSPVRFRFERLEVNPRFAMISRASNAAVLVRLRIDMDSRGGELQLMLPYATLEPVRDLLLQQFMGEKFGRDSIWETHLAEELRQTGVALDVVLDEQTMALSDVLRLQVGDQILLSVGPGAPVRLRCGETSLFEGLVGRRNDRLAVRIENVLPRGEGGRMAEDLA